MDEKLILNIRNMFPLWSIKSVRLSESNNTYMEVDIDQPFSIRGNTTTTLDMDIDSNGHPVPEWLKQYEERVETESVTPEGAMVECIAFNFPDSITNFYISNKKAIDQYSKEHWNRMLRLQFDEVFSGKLEEQHG